MPKGTRNTPGTRSHQWRPTRSSVIAGAALFLALGGSAFGASGLIQAGDIAPGAVTSRAIRAGAVQPIDLSAGTRALLAKAGSRRRQGGRRIDRADKHHRCQRHQRRQRQQRRQRAQRG